jgi:acyl-coenzyme A thioesterase PaaI-like protein
MSAENAEGIPFLVHSACLERRLLDDAALSIEQVNCGRVRINLSLKDVSDFDHRGFVCSSTVYRLIEAALQISAVSVGVEAETLNFCCNIVKYTAAQKLYAVCKLCHSGRTTLVAEAEVYDEKNILLATALTTLFVVETIKDIPRKW